MDRAGANPQKNEKAKAKKLRIQLPIKPPTSNPI